MTSSEQALPSSAEIKARIAALEKEGWQRQFTTDESRLNEMVEFYESLGYEVRVESLCQELTLPECASCFEKFCDRYKTIFVRKGELDEVDA